MLAYFRKGKISPLSLFEIFLRQRIRVSAGGIASLQMGSIVRGIVQDAAFAHGFLQGKIYDGIVRAY